ncbi:MAG TPA: lipoyl(octanoyl) transferase LipB [Gemmatimonadales bacterium]|nr:lipoyl(octanoyl) transferase LipB [Gemmatimonadales bacterium]
MTTASRRALHVMELGRQPYGPVLELQRTLCRKRMGGEITEDLLLLVEHEPVVTLGRGTRATSLPLAAEAMTRQGYEVVEVERGGDVTVHEPGQLVGYPILNLLDHRADLHWYLRQLEEVLITSLGVLGIAGERNPGLTGVWTQGRKIASLGIHVKQWITFHGFALNVVNDLHGFRLVVPCGIDGVIMTNVARELGDGRDPRDVWALTRASVIDAMGAVFDREPQPAAVGQFLAGEDAALFTPPQGATYA